MRSSVSSQTPLIQAANMTADSRAWVTQGEQMLSSEKGTRPRVKGQGGGGAGTVWERNTSSEMPDRVVRNL